MLARRAHESLGIFKHTVAVAVVKGVSHLE